MYNISKVFYQLLGEHYSLKHFVKHLVGILTTTTTTIMPYFTYNNHNNNNNNNNALL